MLYGTFRVPLVGAPGGAAPKPPKPPAGCVGAAPKGDGAAAGFPKRFVVVVPDRQKKRKLQVRPTLNDRNMARGRGLAHGGRVDCGNAVLAF